jgi:hypothetical protein
MLPVGVPLSGKRRDQRRLDSAFAQDLSYNHSHVPYTE